MKIYIKQQLMSFFKHVLVIIFLINESLCANLDFAVIVSKDSDISSISKKSVSNIFLSKTKKLPNGQKAITLGLSANNYEEAFYKKISGKSTNQLRKYWATVIFTGKGQPPQKMENTDEIIKFLKNNANAIAYIPLKDARNREIKIVMEVR